MSKLNYVFKNLVHGKLVSEEDNSFWSWDLSVFVLEQLYTGRLEGGTSSQVFCVTWIFITAAPSSAPILRAHSVELHAK